MNKKKKSLFGDSITDPVQLSKRLLLLIPFAIFLALFMYVFLGEVYALAVVIGIAVAFPLLALHYFAMRSGKKWYVQNHDAMLSFLTVIMIVCIGIVSGVVFGDSSRAWLFVIIILGHGIYTFIKVKRSN